MLIIMVGINKMFIRIANTEDPDQFASSALYGPAPKILVLIPSHRCKSLLLGLKAIFWPESSCMDVDEGSGQSLTRLHGCF